MDVKDVGEAGPAGRGRTRRRGKAVGVEALEGRTLLSATINDITSLPGMMTVGPMAASGSHLWFAEIGHSGGPALADLTASGRLTEVALPAADSAYAIRGVAADPAGNVWFTLAGTPDGGPTGKVGKVAADGTITEYALRDGDRPGGAVVGADGNLWFAATGNGVSSIDRMKADGTVSAFTVPWAWGEVQSLTAGPDGNVWYVNKPKIGKINPAGAITEFPVPVSPGVPGADLSDPQLTAGPDGNVWFLGLGGVSRITPAGKVSTFPAPGGRITSLSAGKDGYLWVGFQPTPGTPFAATPGAAVARLSTDGRTTVLNDRVGAAGASVVKMAAGPNDALWLDEGGGKVGRINLAGIPTFTPPIVTPINKGMLATDAGKTVAGRIATFQPNGTGMTLTDYQAVIDWGDGTVTGATITTDPQGGYDVNGTHTYSTAAVGSVRQANVTITDRNGASATIFALTQITDPGKWQQFPPVNTPTPPVTAPTPPVTTAPPPVTTAPPPVNTPPPPVTTAPPPVNTPPPPVTPGPTAVTPISAPVSVTPAPVATTTTTPPVPPTTPTPTTPTPKTPTASGGPVVAGGPVGQPGGTTNPVGGPLHLPRNRHYYPTSFRLHPAPHGHPKGPGVHPAHGYRVWRMR